MQLVSRFGLLSEAIFDFFFIIGPELSHIQLTHDTGIFLNPCIAIWFTLAMLYTSLFRIGSAIVAGQQRAIPFLAMLPNNPLCFLTYSNRSTLLPYHKVIHSDSKSCSRVPPRIFVALLPQVSLSFINNTALVGSALYLQYMEQCSYFGSEISSHPLKETFRTDGFYYRCVCGSLRVVSLSV